MSYERENVLCELSLSFAEHSVAAYRELAEERHELVLSKQFLRSATSVGANIHEANYAVSKADFIAKMHIALKEASETEYWLILLQRTNYLQNAALLQECQTLKRILIKSLKTAKATS